MRCIDLFARGKYNIILWFYAEEESINMKNTEKSMDTLVNLCKNRGFVYAGSEIYGGLANTWDYGPLGVELILRSSDGLPRVPRALPCR